MLIEFSISNFRSFREKQTFSMVAAPRLRKGDNVFKPDVEGEKLPDLLKVAAIYGPNASGKSNLIKAFDIVKQVANRQPSATFIPFPVAPFRFDPELANQPTRIEIHFIYARQRYQFDLALTQERIVEERLCAFPKDKETLLYERKHTASGDEYSFGAKLEGGKELHEFWRKVTGSQMLFISQSVANSGEELNQLRIPLQWLQKGFLVPPNLWNKDIVLLKEFANIYQDYIENPRFNGEIASFLQEIDVPVTQLRIESEKIILIHQTGLGSAEFGVEDESEGTKNLLIFWSFWTQHQLSKGGILIFDELDSSLHPEIVISLVKKHIIDENPKQLIFTTHDTHLMDAKILRRDQFWLTERDATGATQLRSIHDFAGREGEDIEKRYYEGRYRGLPILRRG